MSYSIATGLTGQCDQCDGSVTPTDRALTDGAGVVRHTGCVTRTITPSKPKGKDYVASTNRGKHARLKRRGNRSLYRQLKRRG